MSWLHIEKFAKIDHTISMVYLYILPTICIAPLYGGPVTTSPLVLLPLSLSEGLHTGLSSVQL